MEESRYLQNALGAVVQTIYDMKQSCEVDTTRLDPSNYQREFDANIRRLMSITGTPSPSTSACTLPLDILECNTYATVWASVLHSIDSVPEQLRLVFHHLREVRLLGRRSNM